MLLESTPIMKILKFRKICCELFSLIAVLAVITDLKQSMVQLSISDTKNVHTNQHTKTESY